MGRQQETDAPLPSQLRQSSFVILTLVLMFTACAAPPLQRSGGPTSIPLGNWGYRSVGGIGFLECTYGGGGLFGSRSKVTFWQSAAEARKPQSGQVEPGGGATFVRLPMQSCPRDSSALAIVLEDVSQAGAAQRSLPRADDASIVDADRLWTDWRRAASSESLTSILNKLMETHGRGIAALTENLQRVEADRDRILGGSVGYPVERFGVITKGTLRTLEEAQLAARRRYPGGQAPALEAAIAPYDQAVTLLKRGQSTLDWIVVQRSRREGEAAESQRLARINADHCARYDVSAPAGHPSEVEMCRALLEVLRSNAAGFAQTMQLMRGVFGQTIGDIAKSQGANMDVAGLDFRKTGDCTPARDTVAGAGFVCRFRAKVQFDDNRLMTELSRLGIEAVPARGFFYRGEAGRWQFAEART
jgi:hypothetical protein